MITVQPGDLVVSGINAAKGAIAVYDEKNSDPLAATIHYGSYKVNRQKADIKYLWWLLRSNTFRDLLSQYVPGGIKTELKAKRLLPIPVPLPHLDEQRRIVAKIESQSTRIDEAKKLRKAIQADMDSLLVAMAHRNDLNGKEKLKQGWVQVTLGDVLEQVSDPVDVEPGMEYPHFGIYSFAKGLFKKAPLLGDEIKASKLYRVWEGLFIYGRLNAYEGAFAIVSKDYDKHHVSNEFPMFECVQGKILPEFLLAYFSTPAVWEELKRKVTGIGGGAGNRRIRLKESVLLSDVIWLPPISWQQKIKTTAEQMAIVKQDRDSAGLELDALLPAILDKAFKGKL
jgi:type I restriction enzyme, S subunit